MGDVAELANWRPATPDDEVRCSCGSAWFRLAARASDPPAAPNGAVTLARSGRVTGYVGRPVCIECGEQLPGT